MKSQGRQISPLSRPERSVQSASTRQLPAHDYTTLITVNQLSIWRRRQQRYIAREDSFMMCCSKGCEMIRNYHLLSGEMHNLTENWQTKNDEKTKTKRCTYEELPPPSQWLWSPRTRYHSATYKRYQVITHFSHPHHRVGLTHHHGATLTL